MKEFFKYVGATVVGIVLLGIVMGVLTLISFIGLISAQESTTKVKDNTVMVLNLNTMVTERAESQDILSEIVACSRRTATPRCRPYARPWWTSAKAASGS